MVAMNLYFFVKMPADRGFYFFAALSFALNAMTFALALTNRAP